MSAHSGKGRSFLGIDDKTIKEIQNIVRTGYKNSSRRTYLISIEEEDKPITRDNRLQAFKDCGVIPMLVDGDPKLPTALYRVSGRLNRLLELVKESQFPNIYLDMGFTFSGLERLKVRKELREVFCRKAPAFYENAFFRAQKHLSDTGLSDPQHWSKPYQEKVSGGGFHIAIVAHFPCNLNAQPPKEDESCIQKFESKMSEILIGANGSNANELLKGYWVEVSVPLGVDGKEHFGYRDGITAPVYSEKIIQPDDRGFRAVHALGEILLGHKRNDGDNLYADLGMTRKRKANIGLQTLPVEEVDKVFFKNSSFGVLRKMEQRVEQLDQWIDQQAKITFVQDKALGLPNNDSDPYSTTKKWIRSKILGRTPNGALLTPNITIHNLTKKDIAPKTTIKNDNSVKLERFHYEDINDKIDPRDDSQGLACPFSSHIRRMNPRDDPFTPFIHRPVIRRGMPYTEKESKGMFGLFICAEIEDQFEHLVGKWANNRVLGIPDDSTCKDPIIGNHEPQSNELYLFLQPNLGSKKNKLSFEQPFIITRGCSYIWFPSVTVLKDLSKYISAY